MQEQLDAALDAYSDCRMGEGTLLDYKREFLHALAQITLAGGQVPTERQQVSDFIRKLGPGYGPFQSEIVNMRRTKQESEIPSTLTDAIQRVWEWMPPSGEPLPRGSAIRAPKHQVVFKTQQVTKGTGDATDGTAATGGGQVASPQGSGTARGGTKSRQGAKAKVTCTHCSKSGHSAEDCWTLHPELRPAKPRGLAAMALKSAVDKPGAVLADGCANVAIFKDVHLLEDLEECEPEYIGGIGSGVCARHRGRFSGLRGVYYSPDATSNLIPMQVIQKQCKEVTGDSSSLTFHFKDGRTARSEYVDGLMTFTNPHEACKGHVALVTTVEGNEASFGPRDLVQARHARRLQEIMAFPPTIDIIRAIKHGTILDFDVTTEDVARADVVYGRHQHAIAGRWTRSSPKPLNFIRGTAEIIEQELHGDVAYINGASFLVCVLKPINMMFVCDLAEDRSYKEATLARCVDLLIDDAHKRGFRITRLHFDGEAQIKNFKTKVPIEPTGAGDHEPTIERAIRMLKERVTSMRLTLPFNLSRSTERFLVDYVVICLNLFPAALNGDRRSPRERYTGRKPTLKSFGDLAFGDYCLVSAEVTPGERKSTKHPLTVGAIAIRPMFNRSRSWAFITLDTRAVVYRSKWERLPMPRDVIDRINAMSVPLDPEVVAALPRAFYPVPQDESLPAPKAHSGAKLGGAFDILRDDDDIDDDPPNEEAAPATDSAPLSAADDAGGGGAEPNVRRSDRLADKEVAKRAFKAVRRREADDVRHRHGLTAMHASIASAINEYGDAGKAAIKAELGQLHCKGVFEVLDAGTAPNMKILPSQMFVKAKKGADGKVTRVKARLVANGSHQVRGAIEDRTSPTISNEALRLLFAISGARGHDVSSVDVQGAYLECDMTSETYMRLDRRLTALLVEEHHDYAKGVRKDGTLIVRLRKALYGTIEAAALWHAKLSGVLTSNGFTANPYDRCLFSKQYCGELVLAAIHVDDVLVSSNTRKGTDHVVDIMKKSFDAINVTSGPSIDYLGMQLTASSTGLGVSMPGYAKECVAVMKEQERVTTYTSPGDGETFRVDENSKKLPEDKKELFHTITAKVLYLAYKTRPDLLAVTSFLCSRVSDPSEDDWSKLRRVIGYIAGTIGHGIKYSLGGSLEMATYIDASHMTHSQDGRGRTGVIIVMAGGAVCFKSSKQPLVAQSSTEAELIALTEGTNQLVHLRLMLRELGLSSNLPSKVYQDNQSTIQLIKNEKTKLQRTKYIDNKYFVVRDRVKDGTIDICYLPTEEMAADVLTKGVDGSTLQRLLPKFMHPI
jgi:hypothetical protein